LIDIHIVYLKFFVPRFAWYGDRSMMRSGDLRAGLLLLCEARIDRQHDRGLELRQGRTVTLHFYSSIQSLLLDIDRIRNRAGGRDRWFKRALDIYTATMGPDHPEVARVKNRLGSLSSLSCFALFYCVIHDEWCFCFFLSPVSTLYIERTQFARAEQYFQGISFSKSLVHYRNWT
jgi:hypothetical protein